MDVALRNTSSMTDDTLDGHVAPHTSTSWSSEPRGVLQSVMRGSCSNPSGRGERRAPRWPVSTPSRQANAAASPAIATNAVAPRTAATAVAALT